MGSRFLPIRQSLLAGNRIKDKQTNKKPFRVLCIGDNAGTGGHLYEGENVDSWVHYGFQVLRQKSSLYMAKPVETGVVGNRCSQVPC